MRNFALEIYTKFKKFQRLFIKKPNKILNFKPFSPKISLKICQIFSENKAKNFKFSPKIHKFKLFFKKAFKFICEPLQEPTTPSLRAFAECKAIHYSPFVAFFKRKIYAKNRTLQGYGLLRLFQSLAMTSEKFQHFFKKMPKFKPLNPNFKAFL